MVGGTVVGLARLRSLSEGAEPELIPPGALTTAAPAIRMLGAIDPEIALECHVAEEQGGIDLTLRVFRAQREALLRDEFSLPDSVARFLRCWGSSAQLARIPFVELEFDLLTHPDEPWIGPAVEPELRRGPQAIQRARDQPGEHSGPAPADETLIVHLLKALGGTDPRTEELVLSLFANLPRYGVLSQLALSHQRPSAPRDGVRVFVSMPRRCLEASLRGVGWQGQMDVVECTITRLAPFCCWVDVDFNITAKGAEEQISFYREFQAPRLHDSGLRHVLDVADDLKLITSARSEGIRRWVRHHHGRLDRLLTFKLKIKRCGALHLKVYLSALRLGSLTDGQDLG